MRARISMVLFQRRVNLRQLPPGEAMEDQLIQQFSALTASPSFIDDTNLTIPPSLIYRGLQSRENFANKLHCAISNKQTATFERLISQTTVQTLNFKDRKGMNALNYAVYFNNIEAVRLLLAAGADINCFNHEGMTPLHVAAYHNFYNMFHTLLHYGKAQVDITTTDNSVNCEKGSTALHIIAENNRLTLARELLTMQPDMNARDFKGNTPLHVAVENPEMVKILINGNIVDINALNYAGQTALDRAVISGNTESEVILIQYGAKLSCTVSSSERTYQTMSKL